MEPSEYYHACLYQIAPNAVSYWADIEAAYTKRTYHNLNHLREMLGHYGELPIHLQLTNNRSGEMAPALFGLSLIYHDVIYIAGRSDNEARSADLLVKHLLQAGIDPLQCAWCRSLIMATKTHQPESGDDGAQSLLIDLDLAVLARTESGYDSYAENVREEFKLFPGFLYRRGRKKALKHFLDQEYIYHTEYFRSRWESRARDNLSRELGTY